MVLGEEAVNDVKDMVTMRDPSVSLDIHLFPYMDNPEGGFLVDFSANVNIIPYLEVIFISQWNCICFLGYEPKVCLGFYKIFMLS